MSKKNISLSVKKLLLVLLDLITANISLFFAYILYSTTGVNYSVPNLFTFFLHTVPIISVCTILFCAVFKLYSSLWEFASAKEVVSIIEACLCTYIVTIGSILILQAFNVNSLHLFLDIKNTFSIYIIGCIFMMILTVSIRFTYRYLRRIERKYQSPKIRIEKNIMIIGAGSAADILIREIYSSDSLNGSKVVCVIDDDPEKVGRYIHGVKIVGTRASILGAVKKFNVNEIIFAIPSAPEAEKAAILDICKDAPCMLTTLPGVYQLINKSIRLEDLHKVEIEDLLGRSPIKLDVSLVMNYVSDKVVLVTGGGGSIGSELCRQIASYKPKKLIIFDIYENNAYDIQTELSRTHPDVDVIALIGSVRDTRRINSVFETYRPEIVYHAAAHKHVPLMEVSPNEAIKNNVFGTLKTVQAADRYKAKRFVMISTDKAVNPTNVMGATKRICEMIIQTYNKRSETEFVAVRFGNVLGSNGSVVPLFKSQIAAGGPVLVTHPEITRFFMTIPEAVSLVLQAGALAKGGEIFVLDMGKPVKILDLAEKIIRLSGYIPYVDIDINFIGLRPGEKLYEEILMDEEGLSETENNMIHIGKPIKLDEEKFLSNIEELRAVMMDDETDIRTYIKGIVPTYHEHGNGINNG